MTDSPLISVVIPLFNGMDFLPQTLASVLSQTYPNIELVITDGGSTDGSREWLEDYSATALTKGYLPSGSGAAANWTLACELSTGAYVKLLCQDDLLYPHAIELQVEQMQLNPQAGMVFSQRDIIDSSGKILSRARGCQGLDNGLISGHDALLAGYHSGTNVYGEPACVLFERSAMSEALPWTDAEPFMLDMFFYSKVLAERPAVVLRESVGAFRVSSASWSTRLVKNQREQFRSWQRHVESLLGDVSSHDRAIALLNLEKTTLLRRGAYKWLTMRNRMS